MNYSINKNCNKNFSIKNYFCKSYKIKKSKLDGS